jgi:hypothetical protein
MVEEGLFFLNKTGTAIRRVAKGLRIDRGKIRRLKT